jgi:glycosyltransferase involved in cell wall biosynthesis
MAYVACSGLTRANTGIGVVQRALYPYLEHEFGSLAFSPVRDLGRSPLQRIRGLVAGFTPPSEAHTIYLSAVPPLPLMLRAPTVSIIHDLRWMRTRGPVSRLYRMWDLKRTVSKSASLICISQRTYDDLTIHFPHAAEKASVAWLGPGLIPPNSFVSKSSGTLLLVGGATHKENELSARLLAEARPKWLKAIVGIGVSTEVKSIIKDAFGAGFGTWLKNVSDEDVAAAYARSEFFMLLGKDEGFGLPFVEALASGCQVIAFDQPLTRELLGAACTYLSANHEANIQLLRDKPAVPELARQAVAKKFSWQNFADAIIACVANRGIE